MTKDLSFWVTFLTGFFSSFIWNMAGSAFRWNRWGTIFLGFLVAWLFILLTTIVYGE